MVFNGLFPDNAGVQVTVEYRHIHPGILHNDRTQIGNEVSYRYNRASGEGIPSMFEGIFNFNEPGTRNGGLTIIGTNAGDFRRGIGDTLPPPAGQTNT